MSVPNPETALLHERQRVLESALSLLAEQGYHETSLPEVAQRAGLGLDAVYRTFAAKEDLLIAVYRRLATDLEARVGEVPAGSVSKRFASLMQLKIASAGPYRRALRQVMPRLEDRADRLAVLAGSNEALRARVTGIVASVTYGARRGPPADEAALLSRNLYRLHLALMWIWARDPLPAQVTLRAALAGTRVALKTGDLLWRTRLGAALIARADRAFPSVATPLPNTVPDSLPLKLLEVIFRRRRLQEDAGECATRPCASCFALHLPLVERALARGEPIELILPAFPAKSPNPQKVLGTLPDLGEELSLLSLQELCSEVRELYPPGARVVICSDGRAFSDLVGVSDEDVSRYGVEIAAMIERLGAGDLSVFRLEDVFPAGDFAAAREHLDRHYAEPLDVLKRRSQEFPHHQRLLNGIHRFLFEDRVVLEPHKSRTRVRKETKPLALRVVQRSNAWTRLIRECYPKALRLSIHPQSPHSEKIGILLTRAIDTWITPWHGTVVLDEEGYLLTKRAAAEEAGARLVERRGRPSHFVAEGVQGA